MDASTVTAVTDAAAASTGSLGWWGVPNPLFGDLDGDNTVGARDLGVLLGRFGVVMY